MTAATVESRRHPIHGAVRLELPRVAARALDCPAAIHLHGIAADRLGSIPGTREAGSMDSSVSRSSVPRVACIPAQPASPLLRRGHLHSNRLESVSRTGVATGAFRWAG